MTEGTPDQQVAFIALVFVDCAFLWTGHESLSWLRRFSFL